MYKRQILQDSLRQADVIARIGGDEFAVLMAVEQISDLKNVIGKIEDSTKIAQARVDYPFSASIGHAGICSHGEAFLEEALRIADKDMYRCKVRNHS